MQACSMDHPDRHQERYFPVTLAVLVVACWTMSPSRAAGQRQTVPSATTRAATAITAARREAAPRNARGAKPAGYSEPLEAEEGVLVTNWEDVLPEDSGVPYYENEFLIQGDSRLVAGHSGPCSTPFCQTCVPLWGQRLSVRGEGLLWWTDSMGSLPPLVTGSPASMLPADAGVLGREGTVVRFGGESEDQGSQGGFRIRLGYELTACGRDRLEASYLSLGESSADYRAASSDVPVLARPYFDTLGSQQAAMLVAHPDLLEGSIAVQAATEFEAAEAYWRRCVLESCGSRLDFLAGYRYARLEESLHINQFSRWTATQGVIVPGTTRELFDRFDAENDFSGALLGMAYQREMGFISLELLMKLGLGNTHSSVAIDGSTHTIVPGGGAADFAGGLLAQPTNMGLYERDEFAVLPELSVTLARQLTPRLRATVGYTFLYWSEVVRPGGLIDTAVSQLPPEPPSGARRPAFEFASDSFWAQGLNLGLDFRF